MSAGRSITATILGSTVTLDSLPRDTAELFAELLRDGDCTATGVKIDGDGSVGNVLAELTRVVVASSPYLCMHAGVVANPAGFIAIPGQSGLGKTTLVAALVQAGFGYVSDEVLSIERETGVAHPFPRPLGLDSGSWRLLRLPGPPPGPGCERLVPVTRFGSSWLHPGRVALVILARRETEPLSLTPGSRGDAVAELLRRSFNHYEVPEASFRVAARLAREAEIWRLSYAHAPDAAALLAERFGSYDSAATLAK